MKILGDMDQIISLPKFALDCPVLRLGANIFGAATTIQNAFPAEFTARIFDAPVSFPVLLSDSGRAIHASLSGRSIALLGTILHGYTDDVAVVEALGTILTNGDAGSLSSITSLLQGLTLPGIGPAGIPAVPPAKHRKRAPPAAQKTHR
jgi:hypothetical protein